VKVGDMAKDTRHSPEYTPRLGLVLSIVGDADCGDYVGSVCWVQYPGSMPIWVPIETLETISESR
jgi:hypothetical protein